MRTRLSALTLLALSCPALAAAADVPVADADGLRAAVESASPGDVILLSSGTYRLSSKLRCNASGTAEAPITVRPADGASPVVEFDTTEGFHITGPHWRVEDLAIHGVCADDSACEHAFHITGAADGVVVRGNTAKNFNAHIKGNGSPLGDQDRYVYPDDVLVEGNEFFSDAPRQTSNPVTPIDVVGGRRWIIRENYIHDFAKGQGNNISYAAFLKGNSRDGVFERNLIVCSRLHSGQVRVGLSFGGGGTGPDPICEDQICDPEHQNGVMRHNIISSCSDVGVYINEGKDVVVEHNTLHATSGIDARFASTTATIRHNVLMGRIRERDGGAATLTGNLDQLSAADFDAIFANPAELDFSLLDGSRLVDAATGSAATSDYCGQRRDATPDIGAVEYLTDSPCDTTMTHPLGGGTVEPGEDAGAGDAGADAGAGTGEDAGAGADAGEQPDSGATGDDAGVTPVADAGGPDCCKPIEERGCGCAQASPPGAAPFGAALTLLALLGLSPRRRRRRS